MKNFPSYTEVLKHFENRLISEGVTSKREISRRMPDTNAQTYLSRDRSNVVIRELSKMGFIEKGNYVCEKTCFQGNETSETNVITDKDGQHLCDVGWNKDVAQKTYDYFFTHQLQAA